MDIILFISFSNDDCVEMNDNVWMYGIFISYKKLYFNANETLLNNPNSKGSVASLC